MPVFEQAVLGQVAARATLVSVVGLDAAGVGLTMNIEVPDRTEAEALYDWLRASLGQTGRFGGTVSLHYGRRHKEWKAILSQV